MPVDSNVWIVVRPRYDCWITYFPNKIFQVSLADLPKLENTLFFMCFIMTLNIGVLHILMISLTFYCIVPERPPQIR